MLFSFGSAFAAEPIVDGKAILALARGTNLCALTFDDGPSRHTARLLDILRERGIRATFFVVGTQVRYHPQLIQRIRDEGHEIGNHTSTHVSLRHLAPDAQRNEISSVQAALAQLGVSARFIRPPYGRYDANTIKIAGEQGMGLMLWSVDSMDWMRRVRFETMKTLFGGQKLRGVFLFHDTHAPTVDAMPELLDRLIADGCRFVTVSEFVDAEGSEKVSEPQTILVEKQGNAEGTVSGTADRAVPQGTEMGAAGVNVGTGVPSTGVVPLQDAASAKPAVASPQNRPLIRPVQPDSSSEQEGTAPTIPTALTPASQDMTAEVRAEAEGAQPEPAKVYPARTRRALPPSGQLPDPA